MHESIAKAETKGGFRVANQKLDAFNNAAVAGVKAKPSRKSITHFVDNIIDVYGGLSLIHKRKKRNSSWHFVSEMVSIDPDPTFEKDIGILHELVIEQANSRNLLKGKSGYRYFNSVFYVHEHYIQRLLQRTKKNEKSDFSELLVNVAFCLANEVNEFRSDADTCHVVYKDIVLIVNFVAKLNKIVFKTILLKERFTERQADFYDKSYLALDDNETDSFACFFPSSGTLRVESPTKGKSAVEIALQFPEQFPENPLFI